MVLVGHSCVIGHDTLLCAQVGLAGTTGIWAKRLAGARSTSIAGGTTEINKSIVAEQGLGLPRDR